MLTGEECKIILIRANRCRCTCKRPSINFKRNRRYRLNVGRLRLNTGCPKISSITEADEVPLHFHVTHIMQNVKHIDIRFDTSKFPDVFHRHYRFHHPTPLDVEAMREALASLMASMILHPLHVDNGRRSRAPCTYDSMDARARTECDRQLIDIYHYRQWFSL